MNMVGNIGAALSAIVFPLLQNPQTGSANTFFVLAAGLNLIGHRCLVSDEPEIACRTRPSPGRRSERVLLPCWTSLFLLTFGVVGYKICRSIAREPAAVVEPNQMDPNAGADANQP